MSFMLVSFLISTWAICQEAVGLYISKSCTHDQLQVTSKGSQRDSYSLFVDITNRLDMSVIKLYIWNSIQIYFSIGFLWNIFI